MPREPERGNGFSRCAEGKPPAAEATWSRRLCGIAEAMPDTKRLQTASFTSTKSTIKIQQPTIPFMGSPGQPNLGQPTPAAEERDSSRLIIGIAVFVVIALALAAAFLLREPPKVAKTASPYAANLKFSDFKTSAAQNFVGATVSYLDGTITNTGDQDRHPRDGAGHLQGRYWDRRRSAKNFPSTCCVPAVLTTKRWTSTCRRSRPGRANLSA